MSSLDFNEDEILRITRALNIHKAHGHDNISIRMIKICDKLLLKLLIILFQNSSKSSYCPDIWKKSNIIPGQEKEWKSISKKLPNNISFTYFGKLFEKIIFNKIYNFLLQEELINPNQPGFRLSDSCVNQLIVITHKIFEAFGCNSSLEVS